MPLDRLQASARYLHIVRWAETRYRDADRVLVARVGYRVAGRDTPAPCGRWDVPSVYSVIEDLAAERYLGAKRRWPHENLATAYRPAAKHQNLDQERSDTTPKTFAIGQDVKISGFPGTIVGSPVEPRGYGPVSAGHYVVRTAGGVTLRYADEIDAA